MNKVANAVVLVLFAGCVTGSEQTDPSAAALTSMPSADVDGIDAVKAWSRARVAAAESDFRATGKQRLASPGFWGAEIVYEIQVDRFNDGDTSNDSLNLPAQQVANQGGRDLWGLPDYRHGGDLAGITQRLDYLEDLGVTTLWVTPVFKHNGDYHGYCTTDFTSVDPGFGTNEELRELVSQAHARGIKVVLDIVVNHMCDRETSYAVSPDHAACARDLNDRYWSGAGGGAASQGTLGFGASFFPPLRSQYFFNRCGANSHDEMASTDPAAVFGDFTGAMFDFDTRNYDFQEIYTNLEEYWIAYADIDGFRMDAAKHVTVDFTAYFATQVRAYAASLGKTNFYVVGEVAAPSDWEGRSLGNMFSNPSNPNDHGVVPAALTNRLWTIRDAYLTHGPGYPGLDGVYDFELGGTSRDVLLDNRATRAVEDYFNSTDFRTLAAQNDPRLSWNVLEIHDWPRFVKDHKNDPWKSKLGVSYLATAQGIPVIYYGMEQGFNGDCHFDNMNAGAANDSIKQLCSPGYNDALYRQDMFPSGAFRLGSTVPSIDTLAYVGQSTPAVSPDWHTDPYLDRGNAVYRTARAFNHIRRSCNPLRYGQTYFRWGEFGSTGLMAFSRIDQGKEMVVVVNNAPTARAIPALTIDSGINQVSGQRYVSLTDPSRVATTQRTGPTTQLDFGGMQIDGNSVLVFAHENNVAPWSGYLGTAQCNDDPHWPPYTP